MRWLALGLLAGCIVAKRPLVAPPNDVTTVLVVTGGLPHPMNGVARHTWFAVRRAGETEWTTYQVGGGGDLADPFHNEDYLDPILHGVWRGDEGERAAACIERYAPAMLSHIESHYTFFPGPNCNTFGDELLRKCHLHASLPATSVGKDWRGLIGAGVTSEGTGVQLETPSAGSKVGRKEGGEVHILGLSFGVDFWPPAIIVPLGPGRLGFADR